MNPIFKRYNRSRYFQNKLIFLLESERNSVDIKFYLENDKRLLCYKNYINKMDQKMLEVSGDLSRKWGRQSLLQKLLSKIINYFIFKCGHN